MRTRVNLKYLWILPIFLLGGCGGGSNDVTGTLSPPARNNPLFDPRTTRQTQRHADQAPIVRVEYLHVGADIIPQRASLSPGLSARGVTTSGGYVADGQGGELVAAYLGAHADPNGWYRKLGYIPTFPTPPTVRLGFPRWYENSTYEYQDNFNNHMDFLVRAVQIVNAALPYEWRLSMVEGAGDSVSTGLAPPLAQINDVPDHEIFVDFAPRKYWPGNNDHAVGIAETALIQSADDPDVLETRSGHVWIDPAEMEDDPERERLIVYVLVHELLHILGFGNHVIGPALADSVLGGTVTLRSRDGVLGHVIYSLDREALLAAYTKLPPGASPEAIVESLETWSSDSFHIRGDIDALDGAAFGIAWRNGLPQPWARGPSPGVKLAGNRGLHGTVGWDGLLRGIDRETNRTVGGSADLDVNLESLGGRLHFSDMKYLGYGGISPDVGTVWGEGELDYAVLVQGNTFVRTGGDEGTVSGAFFGPSHEAMGGTIERPDLAAAFGGSRFEGAAAQPDPQVTVTVLRDNGDVSEIGTTTYSEQSTDQRFSGYFPGTRTAYSYDDWGIWADSGGELLFSAFIDDATPSDAPFVLGLTNDHIPQIFGTPTGSNPVGGLNSATWLGKAFGYEAEPGVRGIPVEGDVRVEVDFFTLGVTARFTNFSTNDGVYDIAYFMSMGDGNGTFRSGSVGDRHNLDGAFYGANHEGVAGTFKSHRLDGVFGAVRQ